MRCGCCLHSSGEHPRTTGVCWHPRSGPKRSGPPPMQPAPGPHEGSRQHHARHRGLVWGRSGSAEPRQHSSGQPAKLVLRLAAAAGVQSMPYQQLCCVRSSLRHLSVAAAAV